MKELSIEEKAKAYDKLIERLKDFRFEYRLSAFSDAINEHFPELKESEDEKIRKEIIVYLQYSMAFDKSFLDKKYNWSQKDCSKWIAWLEKQDEQKPETIFLKFRIGDKVTNGEDTYTINFIGKDRYWVKEHDCATIPFEYQHNWKLVEQNHTDKVEPKFKIGQTIKKEDFNLGFTITKIEDGFYYSDRGDHFPFTDQDNWELVGQKPAWSEEDEKMLEKTIYRLQEWNRWKESKGYQNETGNTPIGWLKSLRPQTTWKPSDEQIRPLEYAIEYFKKKKNDTTYLESLHHDLKKLMEE